MLTDQIIKLIKKANQADINNNFKLADKIDDLIRNKIAQEELNVKSPQSFFQEIIGGGSTTYNEDDEKYIYTINCESDDDFNNILNILTKYTEDVCEDQKLCELIDPIYVGDNKILDEVKATRYPQTGLCLIELY